MKENSITLTSLIVIIVLTSLMIWFMLPKCELDTVTITIANSILVEGCK